MINVVVKPSLERITLLSFALRRDCIPGRKAENASLRALLT
jgi:hypothetical protein